MQLRRPELSDKAAVIDMMKEFEASQSAHDGGFWSVDLVRVVSLRAWS